MHLRKLIRFGILTLISLGGALVVVTSASGRSAGASGGRQQQRPSLVIVVVVDQLRGDLLERYRTVFRHGLRRLLNDGLTFTEARVAHAITVSHPGHVTIATGMHPSHHGIVDGAWFERTDGTWRLVDPTRDSAETITGGVPGAGASPRRILRSTLSEWAISADSLARFAAIGMGNISSVLHAGNGCGDVYWFSPDRRRFVTSSFYASTDPAWVDAFNDTGVPRYFQDSTWNASASPAARRLALADTQRAESDGRHTFFPHRFQDESDDRTALGFSRWVAANTPVVDDATVSLAEAAIDARRLGQRGHTDVLSVVLSATDEIGHYYGPRSLEQLENLIGLDAIMGRFLQTLDRRVGKGNYVLVLTADHGVAEVPGTTADTAFRAVSIPDVTRLIADARDAFMRGRDSVDGARAALAVARASPLVARAWAIESLARAPADDDLGQLFLRSVRPDRRPRLPVFSPESGDALAKYGVIAAFPYGRMLPFDPGVHGSPYEYDRRVPLVFYGAGIQGGRTASRASTADIAPTLASIARIPMPADLDGRVLAVRPGRQQSPVQAAALDHSRSFQRCSHADR